MYYDKIVYVKKDNPLNEWVFVVEKNKVRMPGGWTCSKQELDHRMKKLGHCFNAYHVDDVKINGGDNAKTMAV